jgi:hypothetical protein
VCFDRGLSTHPSFFASVHKRIRIVQGTHAHFSWLAAARCLHLSPPTILHSNIHDQNSPHNIKSTHCFISVWVNYDPSRRNMHLPLVNIKCHSWHSGEIQLQEYCFYVVMKGPRLKVQQCPSFSIRILRARFYVASNALLDLV